MNSKPPTMCGSVATHSNPGGSTFFDETARERVHKI